MNDENSFFTDGQVAQMLKYLGIGTAAGVSTNLLLNMISYLKDKNENAEYKRSLEEGLDSPVIEIDLNELKKTSSILKKASTEKGFLNQTVANALTLLLGASGAYGGYVLADKIHDNIREAELNAQEKAEAEDYYKKLFLLNKLKNDPKFKEDLEKQLLTEGEEGLEKTAAMSDIAGPALGLLLLTALGSGLLTRSILSKQLPLIKSDQISETKLTHPEKIQFKIVDSSEEKQKEKVKKNSDTVDSVEPKDPNEESIDSDNAFVKAFSKLSFEKLEPLCKEAYIKIAYILEQESKEIGSVTNLVKAASYGFCQELENVAKSAKSAEAVFSYSDAVVDNFTNAKFASEISKEREQLAVSFLANSPEMDCVFPQIAAEFAYAAPTYVKLASAYTKEQEPVFAISLAIAALDSRSKVFDKYASEIPELISMDKVASEQPQGLEDVYTSEFCKKLLDSITETKFHKALNI